MSGCARFREVWVVGARGRFKPRKRAFALIFGGGWVLVVVVVREGGVGGQSKVQTPKTSVMGSFSGGSEGWW